MSSNIKKCQNAYAENYRNYYTGFGVDWQEFFSSRPICLGIPAGNVRSSLAPGGSILYNDPKDFSKEDPALQKNQYSGFELGPIRPPSEAYSLLLRINRGCGWNKCRFCGFYRDVPFSIRRAEDVKKDIDLIRFWVDVIQGKQPPPPGQGRRGLRGSVHGLPLGPERHALGVFPGWQQPAHAPPGAH